MTGQRPIVYLEQVDVGTRQRIHDSRCTIETASCSIRSLGTTWCKGCSIRGAKASPSAPEDSLLPTQFGTAEMLPSAAHRRTRSTA